MRAPPLDNLLTPGVIPDAASARAICLTRVSLAVFGIVLAVVPAAPITGRTTAVLALLVFYAIYSVLISRLARRNEAQGIARFYHWADVALCIALLAVHREGNALYALFLVFPIFTASYGWGLAEGLRLTIVSVAVWLTVNYLGDSSVDRSEQLWILSRGILILVLGLVISSWASFERKQKAGLLFLRTISQTPNPRFGRDELMGAYLERLRDFHHADTCMAVVTEADGAPRLVVAEHGKASAPLTGASASSLAATLRSLPEDCSVAFSLRAGLPRFMRPAAIVRDTADEQQAIAVHKQAEQLAEYLDAGSWMTVPLKARGVAAGRLYVMAQKARFDEADLQLLQQVADQMMPTIETVALLDEFASDAAGRERRKISLDLHDSTIQPYLGLKLGLESLRRKIAPDNPLGPELDELCAMTNESIADLRRYIRALKEERGKGAASLMEGINRHIEKFGKLYGIEVELNATSDFRLNDRFTAELLQIVGEGLSNIGRHTQSRWAHINLYRRGSHMVLQIINNGARSDEDWRPFTPKSITQRAAQLGGSVDVSPQPKGGSVVTVDIPL